MDLTLIHRFLSEEAYWSKGVSREKICKGLANSLCFGGFVGADQVAFGRVVTDYASFGYLKDIFVLPAFRGRGYGKQLVEAMLERLEHEGVGTLMLATEDAHGLYRGFGFEPVEGSAKLMRRARL
ncbi:GNAT family N-acetyltransferase [Massilia solisilvae]|uniref:GNAT family N-acetyltransferase n=1 Tax=Massilia solisilvae TaxID=1811225 RepID=A0ABT2BRG4_9BURK|nr:GNAT family N-acetyltransferase [Massilia solisilvae]MCS0611110.1 GNAT family N-acetyltransferase [Massilia solisilvae]